MQQRHLSLNGLKSGAGPRIELQVPGHENALTGLQDSEHRKGPGVDGLQEYVPFLSLSAPLRKGFGTVPLMLNPKP